MTIKVNNFFNSGPFAENLKKIDQFGSNIYMSYLYGQTLSELQEAQRELGMAVEMDDDEDEIKILEQKIIFLESVITLASKNYELYEQEKDSAEH